jgi:hypothetical protein
MRPDEGGCADLRRSRTAHTKLVRSPTYAPARRPRPRAGVRAARACARGVSAAVAAQVHRKAVTRSAAPPGASMGARLPGVPEACGTAPPCAGPPRGRASPGAPALAETARSAPSPPAVITERHVQANRRGGRSGDTRSTARPGPRCREVKSRHCGGHRANRAPLPLDAGASPEFPGIRGECERTARGPWNRARRQHSAIGALSYDTYARAAALISRGDHTPRGPACTRA